MHIAVAAKTAITHISTSHDEYTDNSIYCLQRFQLDAYVCTLYSSSPLYSLIWVYSLLASGRPPILNNYYSLSPELSLKKF